MDSPPRAVAFGQLPVSSTRRLADLPEMGRVVPEFDDPPIREIICLVEMPEHFRNQAFIPAPSISREAGKETSGSPICLRAVNRAGLVTSPGAKNNLRRSRAGVAQAGTVKPHRRRNDRR